MGNTLAAEAEAQVEQRCHATAELAAAADEVRTSELASDVVGDAAGNPVVAGSTDADLGGAPPAGLDDIFVGKIVR